MIAEPHLQTVRSIVAQPTAPFHEHAVRGEIAMHLAQCAHVTVDQDHFGNLIARYRRGRTEPRFAFAAHMDHPGFVDGQFLGGVPESYRNKNPATRDFGAFAMWDLPAFELRDDRIYSRACDDLIGCGALVAMFEELERTSAEAAVDGFFTRAEEVGFIGAIELAKSGRIPRTVTVVSIETSSEKFGGVKMGEGAIVRVGDKTSIFDSAQSAVLTQVAKDSAIPCQRALMSGGTCEATAFQLFGYRTAALCIALGNYHNCGPDERIESEFVSVRDVQSLIQLCVAAARAAELPDPHSALREKLERGVEEHRGFWPEPPAA